MDTNNQAREVLERYHSIIKSVANSVTVVYGASVECDEAEQEARILLMSYAGLMPATPSGHHGSLARIETTDHPRALLASQLRMDLYRHFGRMLAKTPPTYSLNEVIEKEADPLDEYLEDRIIERIDAERDVFLVYPYLTMHVIDDMQLTEIATVTGVSLRTVNRRIDEERSRFIADHPNVRLLKDAA